MTILELICESHNAWIVLSYLFCASDNGKKDVTTSVAIICEAVNMTPKAVRIAVTRLEDLGLISTSRAKERAKGGANGTVYVINCKSVGYELVEIDRGKQKGKQKGKCGANAPEPQFSPVENPENDPLKVAYNKWVAWTNDGHEITNKKLTLSFNEFRKLAEAHTAKVLAQALKNFWNQGKHEKYRSMYITLNNWCKNEKKWYNDIK